MPGRLVFIADEGLSEAFPGVEFGPEIKSNYNIPPSKRVPIVPNDGANKAELSIWGFLASWSGKTLYNARSESLSERKSFKGPYRTQRCLIVVNGFYEWAKRPRGRGKAPHYVKMKSDLPFAIAGLYKTEEMADGSVFRCCTVITTEPNSVVAELHDRMPAILLPEAYELWLTPGEVKPEKLNPLLKPYPAAEMTYHEVTSLVGNPEFNSPECIAPVGAESPSQEETL